MHVLGFLKQIPLQTISYLLHAWYMTQPFRIYAQSSSLEDGTASHQTVLNCSHIYHNWLRNKPLGWVDWVDLRPRGIFLEMNRLLFDCSTISIFHCLSLANEIFCCCEFFDNTFYEVPLLILFNRHKVAFRRVLTQQSACFPSSTVG